jgi:hypothetical protein
LAQFLGCGLEFRGALQGTLGPVGMREGETALISGEFHVFDPVMFSFACKHGGFS